MSLTIGDRYIALVTAHGWTANYIYEWNGATWDETIPSEGDVVFVTDIGADYTFTAGGSWSGPTGAVVDFGMQILTPMNKLERVSRQIDPPNFIATPGIWAALNNDGSLSNVVADTPALINKMVIGSRTASKYESHDTAHGRIATMESIGTRIKLSYGLYVGVITEGDRLVVSTDADTLGKLISAEQPYETGDYEVVARAEEVHITEGWIIIRTVSPEIITLV
jgi:hypothetical protein